MPAATQRRLLAHLGDFHVKEHGRRTYPRAHLSFTGLLEVQHALVEGNVAGIHFDKNVADASDWTAENIRGVE